VLGSPGELPKFLLIKIPKEELVSGITGICECFASEE
jgi:hypothetical protein